MVTLRGDDPTYGLAASFKKLRFGVQPLGFAGRVEMLLSSGVVAKSLFRGAFIRRFVAPWCGRKRDPPLKKTIQDKP